MKRFILTMVVVLGVLLYVSRVFDPPVETRTSTRAAIPTSSTSQVVYRMRVQNCLTFAVTYNVTGGTSQKEITACPGEDVIARFSGSAGDFVYLSAQNTNQVFPQTPFACQIVVNGNTIAEVESVGFAKIASCSGTIR